MMKTLVFIAGWVLLVTLATAESKRHTKNSLGGLDHAFRRSKRVGRQTEVDQIVLQDNYVLLPENEDADSPNCQVGGFWYNPHGSELFLRQSPSGSLRGEFRTSVESECGAAGSNFTEVKGHVHGSLVSFQAFFRSTTGGKSVTSWVGQCHTDCHLGYVDLRNTGQQVLHTTWILTSDEDDCDGAWSQNRIGQNTFTRTQTKKSGPRKSLGTHTPKRDNRAS